MNTNDIVNYVMETPGNTNPVILREMVDANSSSSSGMHIIRLNVEYSESPVITCEEDLSVFDILEDVENGIIPYAIANITGIGSNIQIMCASLSIIDCETTQGEITEDDEISATFLLLGVGSITLVS